MLFALEVRLQLIVERAMECSHSKVSGHGRAGYSHFTAAELSKCYFEEAAFCTSDGDVREAAHDA